MNTQTLIGAPEVAATVSQTYGDEILYPESHDDDMGETTFHYRLIWYIYGSLQSFFRERDDVLIASNLNLYYEEGNPRRYLTPDVMVAFGPARGDRQVYKLWEERVFPQIIFEIASGRTWKNDTGEKAEFCGAQGVEEYYLLDSERRFLPHPLMAYRQAKAGLQFIRNENDRIFSPLLNLEIVDNGKSFRLYDPQKQEFLQAVLTGE